MRRGAAYPRAAFSLIELLVVIAVIAVLLALVIPAVSTAKRTAKLAVCTSNVRQQGTLVQAYAADYRDLLPPMVHFVTSQSPSGAVTTDVLLINETLARYAGIEFSDRPNSTGWRTPTSVFRCPEVSVERDSERETHFGILHFAPNGWLFSTVTENQFSRSVAVASAAFGPWESRYGTPVWRRLDGVTRVDQTVALMDNISMVGSDGGRHFALESVRYGCEVTKTDSDCGTDKRGSHDVMSRRSAVMLDGHAEALPSTYDYWFNRQGIFRSDTSPEASTLWLREVSRFMWFVAPQQQADDLSLPDDPGTPAPPGGRDPGDDDDRR